MISQKCDTCVHFRARMYEEPCATCRGLSNWTMALYPKTTNTHGDLCKELNETYTKKNEAYGDSFSKTFKELGIISAVTRMSDKFNRVKALATGARNEYESLRDTLMDLANYCLMTVMELEDKGNENN